MGIYKRCFGGEIKPTVIVADFPLKWTVSSMAKLYDRYKCCNSFIKSYSATLLDPKIKNRSRLYYMMANIEVSQMKGENNWALMLDPDGFVTEGTGSNFYSKDNKIISPEGRNILHGISRQYIFDLANN